MCAHIVRIQRGQSGTLRRAHKNAASTSELGSSAPGPPTARTTSSDLKVYFALAEQTTKSTDAMTLLTKRSKKGKTALQTAEENELEG